MSEQHNDSLSRRNGQSSAWLWAAAGLGGLLAARGRRAPPTARSHAARGNEQFHSTLVPE